MTVVNSITTSLEKEWDAFLEVVADEAKRAFECDIKPWLETEGFSFYPTMDDYVITRPVDGKMKSLDFYDRLFNTVPEEVMSILDLEVPGTRGAALGSFMPSFVHPEHSGLLKLKME